MVSLITSVRREFTFRDLSLGRNERNIFHHVFRHSRTKMDLNDQLLLSLDQCVTDDKLCVIQELLKKGASCNAVDAYGNRPIHLAILKSPGNSKLVLELIRFGADLNVVNNQGSTPLTFSLFNRCHKTSEILIKRGIDLDFQCRRGWTALMIASMLGDLTSVRMLLLHGANANKCDINKKTALMFACEGSYLNVIKELLENGANPGIRDYARRTVLYYCLKRPYKNLEIINELLLHCASFKNLAANKEESFLHIMNNCLRGEPPYHVCVKTIIEIQMLLTSDYRCVAKFGDLYNFAVSCSAESRFMDGFKVGAYSSVKQLLVKCLDGYTPRESELEALLPFVANNNFPIYSDILRAQLRKSFLRKKFMNMLLYAKRKGQARGITLNCDVNLQIMSYLSDDDVSSFVLASYVKFRREKNRHRSAVPCIRQERI